MCNKKNSKDNTSATTTLVIEFFLSFQCYHQHYSIARASYQQMVFTRPHMRDSRLARN